VAEADDRFRKLVIQVDGTRLTGTVQAFVRPSPELQPETCVVARSVPSGSFGASVALVVGGSRGIGEITAKIIAAGGGYPIITYFQGAADAERVARDIRDWGGRCEILQLDVRRGRAVVRRLFLGKNPPNSLYYFATPRIRGRRRKFFNYEMLDEFNEYYVKAFARMIDAAGSARAKKLRVFYPSSVAVDETTPELAEYGMSKRLAEDICGFYNRNSTGIEVIVERLPRIRTDQNASLLSVPSEDPLQVMLPIVQRMECSLP
jgi:NADP-dependent 3-hydroxy acid dehydrogenase YdfG